MSNSNIIITSIVLGGVATLVAGGIYLLNRPRNSLIKRPNYGPFDKEDDDEDLRFHGGKTKKYHRRNKRNTIKRHK